MCIGGEALATLCYSTCVLTDRDAMHQRRCARTPPSYKPGETTINVNHYIRISILEELHCIGNCKMIIEPMYCLGNPLTLLYLFIGLPFLLISFLFDIIYQIIIKNISLNKFLINLFLMLCSFLLAYILPL